MPVNRFEPPPRQDPAELKKTGIFYFPAQKVAIPTGLDSSAGHTFWGEEMTFVISLLMSASLSFAAASEKVLLNCNTSIGPDQQFTVVETANGLILRELTLSGSTKERAMAREEWKSGEIRLTDKNGVTKVWSTPHGWWVESRSGDFTETAPADCF